MNSFSTFAFLFPTTSLHFELIALLNWQSPQTKLADWSRCHIALEIKYMRTNMKAKVIGIDFIVTRRRDKNKASKICLRVAHCGLADTLCTAAKECFICTFKLSLPGMVLKSYINQLIAWLNVRNSFPCRLNDSHFSLQSFFHVRQPFHLILYRVAATHILQFGFLSTGSWQIFAYPGAITAIKITCQCYLPLHLAVCDAIKYSAFREKLHQTRQNLCEKTPKINIVALLCQML